MKSIILTSCFFFLSISVFAQTVAAVNPVQDPTGITITTTEVTAATVAAHNKIAFAQIGIHLAEYLSYPAKITELALEGTVTATVVISTKGEIARISIAKTNLPKAFTIEVINTLLALEKLELKGEKYLGETILYVPVHFSL